MSGDHTFLYLLHREAPTLCGTLDRQSTVSFWFVAKESREDSSIAPVFGTLGVCYGAPGGARGRVWSCSRWAGRCEPFSDAQCPISDRLSHISHDPWEYGLAEQSIQRAMAVDATALAGQPRDPLLYLVAGALYQNTNRHQAIKNYREVVRQNPKGT